MTQSLGQDKVLKEFRIEVNDKFDVRGHMILVGRGVIALAGSIKRFNDRSLDEAKIEYKFPITIHLKCKSYWDKNEYISRGSQKRQVKEYVSYFKNKKEIIQDELTIVKDLDLLRINTFSKPRNDAWRASVYLQDIEILEAKNVPGLADVSKKQGGV